MHLYNIFKSFLRLFNLSITRYDFYEKLKKNQKDLENFKILVALDRTDIEKKKTFIDISNSELKQDFFVLNTLNFKKGGYFVEFGSGHSTLIAMEAINKNKDNNIDTTIKCIEPFENKWLENLNLEIIRKPLELLDLNWNEELNENDIFFLDSSHIIRPDGDVVKFYLEILPNLKSGVIIHIHDIFTKKLFSKLTFDKVRLWNEQYLLEGILVNQKI